VPEPTPPPPPPDTDGDGILDQDDKCPTEAEDLDKFEDVDGCPDPDNDNDGVPDLRDGRRAADGSVMPADGLVNFGDCLNAPEDVDGFRDDDGCPEPDNDNDGVPDAVDGHRTAGGVTRDPAQPLLGDCANQPEVKNGFEDEDGCPDEAKAEVRDGSIVIIDQVYFDYDKASIKQASFPVLEAVLAILKQYPEIKLVEVQGHTDTRGNDEYNRDLSQRRVDSVRTWLIERGIDGARLVSKGYGETQPIVPNAKTDTEHATNRRVHFKILEEAAGGPRVQDANEARPTPEE
jgi:outer membrane protein OmpA-like peptidoglycan-associated protein